MSYSAASLHAVLDAHAPAGAAGLVLALSGGADSAGLLKAAVSLGTSFRGLKLRAVHIDHGLQSASVSFREACAAQCVALGVPLSVIFIDVRSPPGASLEAAARAARYAALAQDLQPGECLLTAHHREDQAETLLLQAMRGAGLPGMSSMPVIRRLGRGWHLRPVLDVPQAELLALGAEAGVGPVVDPMNLDLRFDRGFLRREIWPLIKARWPGAAGALARAARHAADAQRLLDGVASADVGRLRDGEALSVTGLRALAAQQRIQALRCWLREAGVDPPSEVRLREALRQVLGAQADHMPAIVWGACALRRYRQRLFLTPAQPPRLLGARRWNVPDAAAASGSAAACEAAADLGSGLGELRWTARPGGFDAKRLPQFLEIRARAGGEALKPGATARTKSLHQLCQSHGVLPWMRDALPLVYAGDVLIAVGDLWLDARWRVGPGQPGIAIIWRRAPNVV